MFKKDTLIKESGNSVQEANHSYSVFFSFLKTTFQEYKMTSFTPKTTYF